ncbi:MAG TPA: BON domain-containing protein [Streptosporangiaceae bacterium]|nr:BON domain-containing protein [Streptosporangiaceae bacterium]
MCGPGHRAASTLPDGIRHGHTARPAAATPESPAGHACGPPLSWDPKLDSKPIAVSAGDRTVTLRGMVGSFREKREAGKAAARVYGVTEVDDRIVVEYP